MYIYTYINIYICIHIYICIYIYMKHMWAIAPPFMTSNLVGIMTYYHRYPPSAAPANPPTHRAL